MVGIISVCITNLKKIFSNALVRRCLNGEYKSIGCKNFTVPAFIATGKPMDGSADMGNMAYNLKGKQNGK